MVTASSGVDHALSGVAAAGGSGGVCHGAGATYACCDAQHHPGQLWVSQSHVCFTAARGAQIVVSLERIDAIVLPTSPVPWSKQARALQIVLSGWTSKRGGGGGGTVLSRGIGSSGSSGSRQLDRECFYGLTNRDLVAAELLRALAAINRQVDVSGLPRSVLQSVA